MAIWDELLTQIPYLITLIQISIVVTVSIVLERVLKRYVKGLVKKENSHPT